ncbi:MAG: CHAT domain-containing protein [Bacteroidetes bacterium]|nr:CHAT domain-containing protein [Bacteroidota bacterium]
MRKRKVLNLSGYNAINSDENIRVSRNDNVVLFGNPKYTSGGGNRANTDFENNQEGNLSNLAFSSSDNELRAINSFEEISPLPFSQKEIYAISGILKKNGVESFIYSGEKASEYNLKTVSKPTVLHLATHGFYAKGLEITREYEPDYIRDRFKFFNPEKKSGLLLAGASDFIKNKKTISGEWNFNFR